MRQARTANHDNPIHGNHARSRPGQEIIAALKADTLSLTSFKIELLGWMALMCYVFFHPLLHPHSAVFWVMMQIGMIIAFATALPAELVVKSAIKELIQ